MSVNIKQLDGTLKKVAGNTIILDATASEIREGVITASQIGTVEGEGYKTLEIQLSPAMPDTKYFVVFNGSTNSNFSVVAQRPETGKFYCTFRNTISTSVTADMDCHWYAVRLVELEGYTALQNKVNNPDSAPTENSTNLVTSGGVYDAIKNASSVFIGTSSEWESETSKTDYQVAILTDQPTVNAVDSTDGSTTVVGEPNKRWVGTQAEWDNLTATEKAEYEIVCFNDDNAASGKDIYSTTETKTNKVWIDGKPIYRKVFTDVPFPEEEDIAQADRRAIKRYTDAFPANYISNIVSASFVVINRTYGNEYSLPRTWESSEPDTGEWMIVSINASIISESEAFGYSFEIGSNRTSWNNTKYKVRAIIEYTKTTDG